MKPHTIFSNLPGALLPWYTQHRRDLPWRSDRDPYHIWVSEIMLQQTRVEAVKGYYDRFLQALPTIEALALAEDALLYKLWEGLGYYNRVRNMKKAAQQILQAYNGVFPRDYQAVLSLPGIGEYTAGAICSIAYDLPTPAVDGNVLRVISRLTDDHTVIDLPAYKKSVRNALAAVYPKQAGDFTQALMELGATICGPNRKPDCCQCPCKDFCLGYREKTADKLPVRAPKKKRRSEELTVWILRCGDRFALEKRPDTGLLAGLCQFPNAPGKFDAQAALLAVEQMGLKPVEITRQVERDHIFTHAIWRMNGIYVEVAEINDRFTWLTARQISDQAALPTAFRQFWDVPDMYEDNL